MTLPLEMVFVRFQVFRQLRMGILVANYTTPEGTTLPELYVNIKGIRIVKSTTESTYTCSFISQWWANQQDRLNSNPPLIPPPNANFLEQTFTASDLTLQNIFILAYSILKQSWASKGYIVQDC